MSDLNPVVNVSAQNFQQEVMEASQQQPVLLEIWAQGYDECASQETVLKALTPAYQSKLKWVRLHAGDNDPQVQQVAQSLMMQLQLSTVPALIFLSEGQPVKVLQGLQAEADLKAVFDELTMSSVERFQQQVEELIAANQHQQALDLLQQILVEEPNNQGLQVLQVNVLLELGRTDDAKQLIAALPDDAPDIAQPKAKIEFYEMAASLPTLQELDDQLEHQSDDLELQYQRSVRLLLADRIEDSLEVLLGIMRKDREFREDGARALILKIFDFLGRTHATTAAYRRKLFSLMH